MSFILSGSAVYNATYYITEEFLWNIQGLIDISLDISWNTGKQALYWYRVEGKCLCPSCKNASFELDTNDPVCCTNGGQHFLKIVAATNITDLCNKLQQETRSLKWPIFRIDRFSKPVDADDDPDPTDDCNVLQGPFEFCNIPDCLLFCLNDDLVVSAGGNAILHENLFVSSGTPFVLSGSAVVSASSWYYAMSGGFVLGGAALLPGVEDLIVDMGMNIEVDEDVDFTNDPGVSTLTAVEDDTLIQCGCGSAPRIINITHNFTKSNILLDFLNRNGFVLPSNFELYYRNGSWQRNFHFLGDSGNGQNEIWNIIFEWSCTDNLSGVSLGESVWRFSVFFKRKILITNEDFDTRLLYTFPSDAACSRGQLLFGFSVNTKTGFVQTNEGVLVEGSILFDEIGLFKNKVWINSPKLNINISSVSQDAGSDKFDLQPIIPNPPLPPSIFK